LRPAYLEFKEISAETYDVVWKVPARGPDERLALRVVLPPESETVSPPRTEFINSAHVERSRIEIAGGLSGREIAIGGLESTLTDVLVRVQHLNESVQIERLMPDRPVMVVRERQSRLAATGTYVRLGVEHILLGVDHLLFLLGLLLIVRGKGRLVKTITAFTLAHSLTLAAATLGWAEVPVNPLNVCIALSIFFLGPEVVRTWRGQTSLTIRRPWLVAFLFGLLHGFGFASGLSVTGIPAGELPMALLAFNIGVELGQLGFVAIVLLLVWSWRRLELIWPQWVVRFPGYSIGSLGAFWTIQRTAMMFGFTP
jgi:hydrogenase/urease accessory protein HupE